jgi:hypothetical protein
MTALLWAASVVLLAVGALVIFRNWASAIRTLRTKKPTSFVLFFGGLSGVLGCLVCPDERVNALWWCPLILDLTISLFPVLGFVMFLKSGFSEPPAARI